MTTTEAAQRSTPHVELKRVSAVVNAASGSVGADAAERLQAIAAGFGLEVSMHISPPETISEAVKNAVADRPDLIVVLAGDGTLGLCAQACGADGPLIAALPGGTMNMLPHALSGRRSWPEALSAVLATGRPVSISGGEVAGRRFYVAAILGSPALFSYAREAVRKGRLKLAWLRARRAALQAFKGRLRYALDGGERRKGEALTLLCPLVSRAMAQDVGLEAAALDPKDALEVFRLGVGAMFGRWRDDPSVRTQVCVRGTAWAHGRIPVILDGEPHRLEPPLEIAFRPASFRALVPEDVAQGLFAENAGTQDVPVDAAVLQEPA